MTEHQSYAFRCRVTAQSDADLIPSMNKYLLVINAGSSSIKFAIYQKDAVISTSCSQMLPDKLKALAASQALR